MRRAGSRQGIDINAVGRGASVGSQAWHLPCMDADANQAKKAGPIRLQSKTVKSKVQLWN
jgi:hypothetical protein